MSVFHTSAHTECVTGVYKTEKTCDGEFFITGQLLDKWNKVDSP